MAAPNPTPEQRAIALAKASEARRARAALKEDLKTGKVTVAELFESDEELIKKTKVATVIGALPGYGKVRVAAIMEKAGIAENRRIGGVGYKQKEKLLEILK